MQGTLVLNLNASLSVQQAKKAKPKQSVGGSERKTHTGVVRTILREANPRVNIYRERVGMHPSYHSKLGVVLYRRGGRETGETWKPVNHCYLSRSSLRCVKVVLMVFLCDPLPCSGRTVNYV